MIFLWIMIMFLFLCVNPILLKFSMLKRLLNEFQTFKKYEWTGAQPGIFKRGGGFQNLEIFGSQGDSYCSKKCVFLASAKGGGAPPLTAPLPPPPWRKGACRPMGVVVYKTLKCLGPNQGWPTHNGVFRNGHNMDGHFGGKAKINMAIIGAIE